MNKSTFGTDGIIDIFYTILVKDHSRQSLELWVPLLLQSLGNKLLTDHRVLGQIALTGRV